MVSKSDFDNIFNKAVSELNEPFMNPDSFMDILKHYTDGKTTFDSSTQFSILFIESRKYTKDLVYRVLSELLVSAE